MLGGGQVAEALREGFPKLAGLMGDARDDVLAYMPLPREHWPQSASTNPLERLNGEIKRSADVIGIIRDDRVGVTLGPSVDAGEQRRVGGLAPPPEPGTPRRPER